MRLPVFFAAMVFAVSPIALADGPPPPIPGKLLAQAPAIDGKVDPIEWQSASRFEGLVESTTGTRIDEAGEFWLAYDKDFVYFAAKLVDREPHRISAQEYRTNVSLAGNDFVRLNLDPFGNLADFNFFEINPRGATRLEIAGGRATKREWLGEFTAKARITDEGWEAEARIPWSILRLPAAGNRDLRFQVGRFFVRKQTYYTWSHTNGGKTENFGRWQNVVVPPSPPRTLKLLPYTYVGWDEEEKGVFNSGLDLRTQLTDGLDFVGSINPDFRNIENQVLSLDFSYFERLANESRPFFLEGDEFFQTSEDSPIFVPQRIRTFDTGAKAYGKLGDKFNLGFLNTTRFGDENALVGSVQFRPKERHGINVAFSNLEKPGISNQAWFANGYGAKGPMEVYFQASGTQDREVGTGGRLNGGVFYGRNGTFALLEYFQITNDFLPRLGYAPERGIAGFSGFYGFEKPHSSGLFTETGAFINARTSNDLDGKPYRKAVSANGSLTYRSGLDFDFGAEYSQFRGHDDTNIWVSLEKPISDSYRRWSTFFGTGRLGGRPMHSASVSANYRPIQQVQLSGSVQYFHAFDESETQTILSANWDIGNDRSISGRLVSNERGTNPYLAFRQSGNRGAEYFLIVGDPNADSFRSSLILKASFPFELRI